MPHREEIAHRVSACAREEFGCEIEVAERPIALLQTFDDRGHSVSLCYQATLHGIPGKRVVGRDETPEAGDLRWFVTPPAQLYPSHLFYCALLEALDHGHLGEGIRLFTQHIGRCDMAQTSPDGVIGFDTSLN